MCWCLFYSQNGVDELLMNINETFDRLIENGINPLVEVGQEEKVCMITVYLCI